MQSVEKLTIVDNTANPAPLGLLGFGMTTILLNLANAGIIPLTSMIMAMGIFVGGLAQVIAGIMEWKKNNTFGTTAFTGYGFFWISLVAIWTLPKMGLAEPTEPSTLAYFLMIWGIFTLGMWVGTLRLNKALQWVFGTLVILFFLLVVADFSGNHTIKMIAGFEGIICGLLAVYTCLAQIINEVYGKTLLPIGPVKK